MCIHSLLSLLLSGILIYRVHNAQHYSAETKRLNVLFKFNRLSEIVCGCLLLERLSLNLWSDPFFKSSTILRFVDENHKMRIFMN